MTIDPAPLAKLAEVSPPPRPEVEVDDFDLALLRALAADSRQSQRALARQIEMSPPAVADRLARLERSGVIRGYRADIDWAALGLPVVVYLAVTAAAGMDLTEIIRQIQALPEAETMSVVTGSLDLLVRLRVRDHTHLRQLLLAKIFQITGVQRTETFLSIADIDPDNFTAALLEDMIQQRDSPPTCPEAHPREHHPLARNQRRRPARLRRPARPVQRRAGSGGGRGPRAHPRARPQHCPAGRRRPAPRAAEQVALGRGRDRRHGERPGFLRRDLQPRQRQPGVRSRLRGRRRLRDRRADRIP